MAQNKREIIAEAINAGGATIESLMEVAEVNKAGLSSQFTYLRLTGKYPVKDDNGVFSFVDEEAWNEMKASASARKPAAPAKSPEERMEALVKRQAKLQAAFSKKEDALLKLNRLRLQKAEAEVLICNIEVDAVEAEIAE